MATNDSIQVLGALALELVPGSDAPQAALSQQQAGELARLLAQDLATFAPEAAALELVTVGAHYDAVELLRPQLESRVRVDELCRDPQLIAVTPHAAFDDRRDIEFPADRPDVDAGLAEPER